MPIPGNDNGTTLTIEAVLELFRTFEEPWRVWGRAVDCGFVINDVAYDNAIYVIDSSLLHVDGKERRSVILHTRMWNRLQELVKEVPFRPQLTDTELATLIAYYAEKGKR